MHLPPSTQNQVATQIADLVRLTTVNYKAVASNVGHAGYPEAAIVAITKAGKVDCVAKVAVYHDRLVYMSATGTHVSYPTHQENAGHIISSFLSAEHN